MLIYIASFNVFIQPKYSNDEKDIEGEKKNFVAMVTIQGNGH